MMQVTTAKSQSQFYFNKGIKNTFQHMRLASELIPNFNDT